VPSLGHVLGPFAENVDLDARQQILNGAAMHCIGARAPSRVTLLRGTVGELRRRECRDKRLVDGECLSNTLRQHLGNLMAQLREPDLR
jgi:hypothetical protein